ncbi:DUF7345 domain-containing protein [Halapricum salinum]|uniref:DUF7345 domain-containing protein n=1 Tax=Halapricum salinum TaxID=1457250 RepID=UPI00067854EE|nr:hypothetical protein [Halapricum salinum]
MTGHAARVVLVAALVVSTLSGVAVAIDDPHQSGLGSETFAQTEVDPDSVVLGIDLAENGTASWEVSYRVELTTDNETAAFESLQSDIEANTSAYLSAFRDRMERTARTAENTTGREMSIRGLSVSTSIESVQQYGTVTYRFRWTNFAAVDGETIRMGDALAGFFLESNTRLTATWPDGYDATTVSPEPDDRRDQTVTWRGPIEFGAAGPQVTASPASSGSSFPIALLAFAALLAVGMVGTIWLVFTRDLFDIADAEDTTPDSSGGADTEAIAPGSGADRADAETASENPQPDEELLSNEERVLRLLDERGGRVKQQEVASEFDWTDAKTSQVVKSLREDDEIDVFRLGRENVLVDPEESEL